MARNVLSEAIMIADVNKLLKSRSKLGGIFKACGKLSTITYIYSMFKVRLSGLMF